MVTTELLLKLTILVGCILLGLLAVGFPYQSLLNRLRGYSKLADGCYYVRSERGFRRAFRAYVREQPPRHKTLYYGAIRIEYPCEINFEAWVRKSELVVMIYETNFAVVEHAGDTWPGRWSEDPKDIRVRRQDSAAFTEMGKLGGCAPLYTDRPTADRACLQLNLLNPHGDYGVCIADNRPRIPHDQ